MSLTPQKNKTPNRGQSLTALLLLALLFLSQGLSWLHPHDHKGVSELLGLRFSLREYKGATFCTHGSADVHMENTDLNASGDECASCQTLLQLTEDSCAAAQRPALEKSPQPPRHADALIRSACTFISYTRGPPADTL